MLEGLQEITGARVGLYMQIKRPFDIDGELLHYLESGFLDESQRANWIRYLQDKAQCDDPFWVNFIRNCRGRLRTCDLSSLVERREWELSRHYNEYIRTCDLDDRLATTFRFSDNPDGVGQTILLLRDASDGCFPETTRYLMHLFHHELSGLVFKRLSLPDSADDPTKLPLRLAQVLDGLLNGESEKQIARRLDISHHTVNRHVQRLYRHFNVNSRAKLMTLLLKS